MIMEQLQIVANLPCYKSFIHCENNQIPKLGRDPLDSEMARILLACLILTQSLMVLAMATKTIQTIAKSHVSGLADSPTFAPSHASPHLQQLPSSPLGSREPTSGQPRAHSSSEEIKSRPFTEFVAAPRSEEHANHNGEEVSSSHQPLLSASVEYHKTQQAEPPTSRRLGRHHSSDKSVAGGGVILGGLATTFLVSVFCYIRATRRRNGETTA